MNTFDNTTNEQNIEQETIKLFRIFIRHTGSKSSVELVKQYVLAKNEKQILSCIADNNSSFLGASGVWLDRHNEDGLWSIRKEDGEVTGQETYFERMLRLRGEYFEPTLDYNDSYYGLHHYGWDEGKVVNEEEIQTLLRLNIAEDWTHYSSDLVEQSLHTSKSISKKLRG